VKELKDEKNDNNLTNAIHLSHRKRIYI